MASTVSSIISNGKTIAAAVLGVGWREMANVLDLTKNDSRRGGKSYGMRAGSASPASGVTNTYTLEHTFEFVLMDSVPRMSDSAQATAVIGELFDKLDEIFKQFARTKLNLPSQIILVAAPSLSEPEFVEGNEMVAVRMQVPVRYRQAI